MAAPKKPVVAKPSPKPRQPRTPKPAPAAPHFQQPAPQPGPLPPVFPRTIAGQPIPDQPRPVGMHPELAAPYNSERPAQPVSGDIYEAAAKRMQQSNLDITVNLGSGVLTCPGYEQLAQVLTDAFRQASVGKGAERHADSKPFHEQPMQEIANRRGIGFILGQVDKKTLEAEGMLKRGDVAAWERELHGAIVYLAGAIINVRNNQQ